MRAHEPQLQLHSECASSRRAMKAAWQARRQATMSPAPEAELGVGDDRGTVAAAAGFPIGYGGVPIWSSDGRTIAVKASMTDFSKQLLIDADTGIGHELDLGMPIMLPFWSPDGSLIAFDSGDDAAKSVFVAAPDGTGVTRVSADGRWAELTNWEGTFTPDGRSVKASATRG